MGLLADIYKAKGYNTPLNKVSYEFTQVCIVNIDAPFEPREDCPPVKLIKNTSGSNNVVIVPVEELEKKSWTMFGGSYCASSDSRFNEKIKELTGKDFYGAVPIHDRVEEWR